MNTAQTDTLKTAHQAFDRFTHGLATGEWQAFLDMVTEDFSFWFPIGPYHGLNTGKARTEAFLQYVSDTFEDGLTVTLDRVMSNDTTVVFEFRDEGMMRGQPYKNRVAIAFDVRGDKICAYREYFGSDGKSY
ncbi:nuclear transport factor 2 family protein [Trichocoleus sp. FACHB-591]|uniref:nuclear transport factor 2 family protein n=1 Tax=Trichocoleus sp. FACHB-591 TaxID=2692872 RepID=UPI001682E17A|nr:nuclear transport factor 2 family protein [Trichocoleus sp. FACHB-591]MBD2098564.1 nuclear transport factor 2 family protein [Trichocoleus sp. FACHB-591]